MVTDIRNYSSGGGVCKCMLPDIPADSHDDDDDTSFEEEIVLSRCSPSISLYPHFPLDSLV